MFFLSAINHTVDSNDQSDERKTKISPYQNAEELASLGLDRLKSALIALGLKCGGNLEARAERLFSTKGKTLGWYIKRSNAYWKSSQPSSPTELTKGEVHFDPQSVWMRFSTGLILHKPFAPLLIYAFWINFSFKHFSTTKIKTPVVFKLSRRSWFITFDRNL